MADQKLGRDVAKQADGGLANIGRLRTAKTVTVSIANYNGRAMLETVLTSLANQTYAPLDVVVVDDASTDDSVTRLQERWPDVHVIEHARNRGVTCSLNDCLQAGFGEFVLLLNNDLELDPRCIAELVKALDCRPEAAVACAKLIDFYHRDILDGAGDIYTWGGEAHRRGQGALDRGQYEQSEEVFSACAAAAVYRRSALEKVGLFDERMYAIYEDVDWCFRARLLGESCVYVSTAVAYHMGSATIGREPSEFTFYHNWRNGIWVVAKNYPLSALLRHSPELMYVQLRNLAISLRHRRLRMWLRVWCDALRGMPDVLRERRRIQRQRTLSVKQLGSIIGRR